VANVIPVDVAIPGCPPTPLQLMRGILAALGGGKKEGEATKIEPV
jgi:Ni,Fe-hydrogenase III small subunit